MKTKIWNIVLAAALVGLIIYSYKKNQELNALENSIEILDENFEERKEENRANFNSIQDKVDEAYSDISYLETTLSKLDQKRSTINAQSNENKSRIDRITDADSLTAVLTRRYE